MKKSPRYDNPPIVEVVCGIKFDPIESLKVPHFGTFWAKIRTQFPHVEEHPPIRRPGDKLKIAAVPPMPRLWFQSEDRDELIQVQSTQFYFNWKREGQPRRDYASFDAIYSKFAELFSAFQTHVTFETGQEIKCTEVYLTYVNTIFYEDLEGFVDEPLDVLVDHTRKNSRDRYLPSCTDYRIQSDYKFDDNSGTLSIVAASAVDDQTKKPCLRVELSTVNPLRESVDSEIGTRFREAHDWIVYGFSDVMNKKVQEEVWGRK